MAKSHASRTKAPKFQQKLLEWYDRHRRVLPWRAKAGKTANPYFVWLSEIMLQQTTVQAVGPYFEKFIAKWPTVSDLAAADFDEVMHEWAGLGYYARARNLLKCAITVRDELNGVFPVDEAELQKLPGIGPYTSAAIAAIAFNQQATVIDGNVERVVSRVCLIEDPLPLSKPLIRKEAHILFQSVARPGDFAQAMMDLGATVCTPQSPKCGMCPVSDLCLARKSGRQSELPAKVAKKARPQRKGEVFWLVTPAGLLVEKRDPNRMLGGMMGLPTSDWDQNGGSFNLSGSIRKRMKLAGTVHHTFTHFDLSLDILEATITADELPQGDSWKLIGLSDINNIGFPTLFKKVVKFKMTSPGPT